MDGYARDSVLFSYPAIIEGGYLAMTAMLKADIVELLRRIIAELTGKPSLEDELQPEQDIQLAGMDSMRIIQLVIRLEQYYAIGFEDHELAIRNFDTMDAIADRVLQKTGLLA
jgi:acyl carrier protein